jgi:hypothetical protein
MCLFIAIHILTKEKNMKNFLGRGALSLGVLSLLLTTQVEATPVFSAQYKMKCNSCHSMMPTLNKTGLMFLRNGFRFSKDDQTMASKFLDANSSKTRVLPIRGLVGLNIDSKNRDDVEKVNMYFGGSLTDTLSVYAITRSTYNKKKNHNLFGETNSRAFFQWNPDGNKHVAKVGWMDPLTMFSNLDRTLMDNALMGSGLMKKAPKSAIKPTWAKKPPLPPAPGPNATPQEIKRYNMMKMPKQPYMLPVPYAGVGLVKGAEYSYLHNDKALFLVNYGIPSSPSYADDSEDTEITAGVELRDIAGYNIGAIYNHTEIGNIESDSYILPVEKEFFDGQLMFQQSFVYKDSEQYDEPYYGSQTTFTYELDDESQVRAIASADRDEAKDSSTGYAMTYSKSWNDKYLIHLTGARHKGEVFDESIAKLSAYMFF